MTKSTAKASTANVKSAKNELPGTGSPVKSSTSKAKATKAANFCEGSTPVSSGKAKSESKTMPESKVKSESTIKSGSKVKFEPKVKSSPNPNSSPKSNQS